jgi:hypothetical protein
LQSLKIVEVTGLFAEWKSADEIVERTESRDSGAYYMQALSFPTYYLIMNLYDLQ